MTRETETTQPPRRYQIPTHLNVPDKIGINFLGLGLELTVKQGLICLIGSAISLHFWHVLDGLARSGMPGATLRLLITALIIVCTLLIAFVRIADRSLDTWCGILLDYALQPKVYVWKSIIHDPTYRLYEGDEAEAEMALRDEEVEEC